MRSIYLLGILLLAFSAPVHATNIEAVTEAASCTECSLNPSDQRDLAAQVSLLSQVKPGAGKQCDLKTIVVDPKQKSILEDLGFPTAGDDPIATVGRSAVTCLYGALKGGAQSIRDLVMAVPGLIGLTWDGMKGAGHAVAGFDYAGWLNDHKPAKMMTSAKHLVSITKESIGSAFKKASSKIYNSYEQGGATGAVAAVAQAAYALSPNRVIGQFLANLGAGVAHAVANEWGAFTCLPAETMSQVVCQVIGYIGTDIATGKIAISAISKLPKFAEVVIKVKAGLEDKAVIGPWLMRNLKRADAANCEKIPNQKWMKDAALTLQRGTVEVAKDGNRVLARGIDPITKLPGCFELAGEVAIMAQARVTSTESRGAGVVDKSAKVSDPTGGTAAGNPSSATNDFFSASSKKYARTTRDFVQNINEEAALKISKKDIVSVSQRIEPSLEDSENYGRAIEAFSKLRNDFKSSLPAEKKLKEAAFKEGNALMDTVNRILAKPSQQAGGGERLNLQLVRSVLAEAAESGDTQSVKILNRVLSQVDSVTKRSAKTEDSIGRWETNLRKSKPGLTDQEVQQARSCLFSGGISR